MKKILFFAALVLGMASCQTEPEGLDVMVGGEQEVMLNVSLPESTRSASSAGFNFSNFESNGQYDLRFILEIAYNNGTETKVVREVKTSETTSTTFPVRLVPERNYTFTVWADLVKQGSNGADLYYNILTNAQNGVSALSNITFKEWTPNVEARDAYTYTDTFEFGENPEKLKMTLTRPFAKVRVVATDIADVRKFGIKPESATVAYTTDLYTAFDAVNGTVKTTETEKKSHSFVYANVDTYEATDSEQLTVFADYIFVPADGTVQFKLDVYADEAHGGLIKSNSFSTAIPVEKNKVTSIVGDVLTKGGNVSVTVDGTLGQKETINYVDTAESLVEAINNIEDGESANIKLGDNIVLRPGISIASTRADVNYALYLGEGKSAVIDLNGKTISTTLKSEDRHYYAIENHGNLTIKDSGENGAIVSRGIFNYGTLTLESGKIDACDHNGGYAVQCLNGAEFIMNGGTVTASNENGDAPTQGYDATTLRIEEGGKAKINSGVINNLNNYTFAIDNHGEVIVNGGTITAIHSTVSNYDTIIIDGGTFTCDGLEGVTAHALVAWNGSETTINGGTFDGKDNYNGFNVNAEEGAVVNIYAGTFNPVHSGSLYGKGTISVYGGTFFDDPSARLAENHEAVKGENNYWTVDMTEESKLRKVLAEGGEITLQKDITIAAQLEVTTTKAIVVNGNNKTINYTGSNRAFNVNGLDIANVTLNNLTFVNTASYSERCINFNVDGALTLDNVTVGATGTPATYAINLPGSSDGAKVVINNSYIRGHIALNIWGENVDVNATDTIFSNYDTTEVEDYTTIVLNNDGSTVAEGAVVNIIGGKVIGKNEKGEPLHAVNNGTVTGVVNISETTECIGAIKETVAIVDYNSTSFYSYSTLQGAIDKVCKDKSGFVRLVKDITVKESVTIPADGTVTINLNGKTITGIDESTKSFGLINNSGNLTITNGNITLTAKNEREWNAYSSVISNQPKGVLIIEEGANIEHLGGTAMAYGIDNLTNGGIGDVTATINGGTIKSTYRAIRQFLNSDSKMNTLVVNGGTIEGNNKSIWMQDASKKSNKGTLTVNTGAILKGNVYLYVCEGSTEWPVEVSIAASTLAEGSEIMTGNVPAGYAVIEENGVWVVRSYVAVIGDKGYNTLNEAVAAVQDGETITLTANEVFSNENYYNNGGWKDGLGYAGDKSFTIDLNGKTVSQNGALNDYLLWFKNVGSKENTITIKNGTLDAGKTAFCALCTASSHDNKLTINLENITLINEKSDGSTIKVRAGSTVNVNADTKIIGKDSYLGIENWNATVNVYDGAEIYMNGTSSYNGCLIGVGGNGVVNVYGGYGKGVSGGLIAMTSGGTINVSGGEWIANTDGTYANSNKSVLVAQSDKQYNAGAGNAVVNVTGGTFKGGYNCYGNAAGDAQINISGGNFNNNPSTYVVEGHTATEANGVWTVQ